MSNLAIIALTALAAAAPLPDQRDGQVYRTVSIGQATLGDRLKPGGDTGFDARFSGYSDPHRDDAFVRLGERAAFWTSTEAGRDDISALAWHRDISENRNTIWRSKVKQTSRMSVRCVADSDQVAESTGAPSSIRSRLPGSWSMRTTPCLPSNI